mgnify:FL=1
MNCRDKERQGTFTCLEKLVCSLPIVKFQLFLLDRPMFYQSWPKDR